MLVPQLIVGVCISSLYILMALSVVIAFRGTKLVNFAQGEMAALGTFLYVQAVIVDHQRAVLGWVLAIAAPIALAVAFGLMSTQMEKDGADEIAVLTASFGVFLVVSSVTTSIWGANEPYQLPALVSGHGFSVSGETIPYSYLIVLGLALVVGLLLYGFSGRTKVGLLLRAVVANREGAALAGVNTRAVQLLAWLVAGLVAGVAAFLYFQDASVSSGTIDTILIPSFSIAAAAGFQSIGATILIGVLYGVSTQLFQLYSSLSGTDLPGLSLLVLLLFLVPRGLFVAPSNRTAGV